MTNGKAARSKRLSFGHVLALAVGPIGVRTVVADAAKRPAWRYDDVRRPVVDTTVVDGLRVRQRRATLVFTRAGRIGAHLALDTVIHANGEFSVSLVDAVQPPHVAGDRTRYVILLVQGASNAHEPSGFCGAGTERALVWLALDAAARVRGYQRALVGSCWSSVETTVDTVALSGDSVVVSFWAAGGSGDQVLRYRRSAPERGFEVRPAPRGAR